jgi:oxidase EvaA
MMSNYAIEYNKYIEFLKLNNFDVNAFSEFKFESLRDWSKISSIADVVAWYEYFVKSSNMKVDEIPLKDCRNWFLDPSTGSMHHSSGEFFRVCGFRVTGTDAREVVGGWDQPLLAQVGHDGGILGLLRKRIDGVPHYLVEAKEEPGNYNIVQISPTVQATYSNLKKAHKGKSTNYSDIFLNPKDHPVKVIFDQWTSEDGGRLFNKRNRSMLLEYSENEQINIVSDRFKWVSLFQLKYLIANKNAIVAPHIRGILSGV